MARVRSTQKLPTLLTCCRRESANQRDSDADAGRGGREVLHGERGHLDEVA